MSTYAKVTGYVGVRSALVAIVAAQALACGVVRRPPAPPAPEPTELAVAVIAQDQSGTGIAGALVGIGDQRGEGNADGYRFFEHVPICQQDDCRLTVHVEAKGFLPYDGIYQTWIGMPDFQVRLQPLAPPPPPRPYAAEVGWLRVNGRAFVTEDGRPWTWVGVDSFRLLELHVLGFDVSPQLDAAVRDGFNIIRVFGMYSCQKNGDGSCNLNTGIGWFTASEHADYYDKVASLAALAASKGIRLEIVALADAQNLMTSNAAQLQHVKRILAAVASSWNVVVEIGNEPFKNLPGGAAAAEQLWRDIAPLRGRTLVSIGNYDVADGAVTLTHGDYLTIHTERKDEWPRTAKDMQDVQGGWQWPAGGSFQGVGVPVVDDEGMGASATNQPGRRSNVPEDYLHFGAACALFGGCTFHSDSGIQSVPLGPVEQACATAFVQGIRFPPPAAQTAPYQRGDQGSEAGVGNMPMLHRDEKALRTFCKPVDGREYCVAIRPSADWQAVGRDGWRVELEPRRGLVQLVR